MFVLDLINLVLDTRILLLACLATCLVPLAWRNRLIIPLLHTLRALIWIVQILVFSLTLVVLFHANLHYSLCNSGWYKQHFRLVSITLVQDNASGAANASRSTYLFWTNCNLTFPPRLYRLFDLIHTQTHTLTRTSTTVTLTHPLAHLHNDTVPSGHDNIVARLPHVHHDLVVCLLHTELVGQGTGLRWW